MLPFIGLTSTQGNHWSPAAESTSVGPLQEAPPSDETMRKTSVFVTGLAESCTPLRLSLKTRESFPSVGLATILPAEFTRTWCWLAHRVHQDAAAGVPFEI